MKLVKTVLFVLKCKFFSDKVLKAIFLLFLVSCSYLNSFGQATYTWVPAGGGSWAQSNNWSPSRTAPAANDILVFNNGGTKTILNVPTQTIGALLISNNSNITLDGLNAGGGGKTLTIGNVTGINFSITNGSSLTNIGTLDVITLSTNSTSDISGTLYVVAGKVFNTDATGVVTTVTGTINNLGTVTCTNATRLLFQSVGTYIHRINAGTIPTATWGLTTNCNITGVTNTAPAGLNQAFGNFTWDCLGHSGLINLNSNLTTINGNFRISNAGQFNSGNGRTQNGLALSSNNPVTLNVGGNFIIEQNSTEASWFLLTTGSANVIMNVGGNFNMSRVGTGPVYFDCYVGTTLNTIVLNVTGNYVQTGGWFDWALSASASGSNFVTMNLTGNFTHSGTSVLVGSTTDAGTPNGKIIFTGGGTSTFSSATPGNIAYTNFEVASGKTLDVLSNISLTSQVTPAIWGGRFEILGGATLDMNTFQIVSSSGAVPGSNNAFILNSTARVITANINGLQNTTIGSVSTSIATRTYNSGADYTYDGTAPQNSGTFVTTPVLNQVNNLTISNTSGNSSTGVTLQQPIAVAGTVTFNAGLLTTTYANLLTVNNDAFAVGANNNAGTPSFANGPVKKIGDDAFSFPVGKLIGGYHFIGITAPANSTDAFTAEYLRANARLLGPVLPILTRVSQCEYWLLNKNSNEPASISVILSWNTLSPCNSPKYIINPGTLTSANFNGTNWINTGVIPPFSGNTSAGNITSNQVSSFGNFALGSIDVLENILPNSVFELQLQKHKEGIAVNWKNAKEEKVAYYQVMRSANGKDFIPVAIINAAQNNGNEARYTFIDKSATQAVYYYRIKLMNIENDQFYSNTAKMNLESRGGSLNILSNPVTDHRLGLQLNDLPGGIYNLTLVNSSGQVVYKNNINHISGSSTYAIQLSSSLTKGVYYLQVNTADNKFTKSILIQ